jgi:hypothetical protein
MLKAIKALTIILTLLALATSASAECAWVMWTSHRDAIGQQPTRRVGVDRRAQRRLLRFAQGDDEGLSAACILPVVRRARGVITTYTYSCLPDTIDPRGPKGK